jgi:hypothetical protein
MGLLDFDLLVQWSSVFNHQGGPSRRTTLPLVNNQFKYQFFLQICLAFKCPQNKRKIRRQAARATTTCLPARKP